MAIRFSVGYLFVLIGRVVHGFAYGFSLARDIYALLPVKCSGFGRTRDISVRFSRFGYLFPQRVLA